MPAVTTPRLRLHLLGHGSPLCSLSALLHTRTHTPLGQHHQHHIQPSSLSTVAHAVNSTTPALQQRSKGGPITLQEDFSATVLGSCWPVLFQLFHAPIHLIQAISLIN
ncbi:hypothetical protein SRHO_G00134200 [Serrasalmus rhombeus]